MDDLISRQAAIDALVKRTNLTWENLKILHPFLDMLEKLPSAERLEVQSSGCEYWDNESNFCSLYRPSAERRGRWIEEYSANHFQAKCSVCGESTLYGITYDLEGNAYYMNYCPNCGARMDGGENG